MSKNKQARRAREAALRAAQTTGGGCASHVAGSLIGSQWPRELSEMADRIYKEGENSVPNRHRDILARGMPLGSVTRRDGSSIRPQYRDFADA